MNKNRVLLVSGTHLYLAFYSIPSLGLNMMFAIQDFRKLLTYGYAC